MSVWKVLKKLTISNFKTNKSGMENQMIEVKEVNRDRFCNSCGTINDENMKIYELQFSQSGTSGIVIQLCESCIEELSCQLHLEGVHV